MPIHYEFYKSGFEKVVQRNKVRVGGIVHVGAHMGQEVEIYERMGFDPIVLVEANPDLASVLVKKFGSRVDVVNAAAGAEFGVTDLHVVDHDTQLSSLYTPARPCDTYHDIKVPLMPLSAMIDERVNVAVIDVQGAELDVMQGMPVEQLDLIVLETGTRRWYDEQPMHHHVDSYMRDIGWKAIHKYDHGPHAVWFDVFYMREHK